MSRFVRPDDTILKISNGDTLTVRRRLNHGEQSQMFERMYLAGVDGRVHLNVLATGIAIVTAYLIDWSLTGEDGRVRVIRDQPIEVVTAALNELSPEDFGEIRAAIEAHERAMAAERSAAKKIHDGETDSVATSPSLGAAGGGLNGSASLDSMSMTN